MLAAGRTGQTYNIGGWNEMTNLEVVHTLCDMLDRQAPKDGASGASSYRQQITYVTDRPGHDRRYAIDARKIEQELGWKPAETFASGIAKTVRVVSGTSGLGARRAVRRLFEVGGTAIRLACVHDDNMLTCCKA